MTCRIPDRVTVLLLVGYIVFLLPGCARYSVEPFPLHDATVSLVWPRPPNPPRIRFLREINGPEQVAPSSGKLERLWELVTGERKQKLPFATPYGLVADNGSVIYVADPSAGVVHRYDLGRRDVSSISQAGDDILASPVGLALDQSGKLYVSDSVNGKVYLFSPDGAFLNTVGGGPGVFQRPAGLALDSGGNLFVVDVLAHKLKVFDGNGRYIGDFPPEGAGEHLNLPSNVVIDQKDSVFITDSMNFSVKVYNRDGKYVRSIGQIGDAPGSFARPRGIAVDSDGHLYVVDASFDNFQIFDQEGKLLLFVGKSGKNPGEFFLPSGIFIDRNDRIYISDTYNHRIQIFEYLKKGTP